MPRVDGISAARTITAGDRPPAGVVLTTFENDDHVYGVRLAAQPDTLLFLLSNRETAATRSLGLETVQTHVAAVLAELGVRVRPRAVVSAQSR